MNICNEINRHTDIKQSNNINDRNQSREKVKTVIETACA